MDILLHEPATLLLILSIALSCIFLIHHQIPLVLVASFYGILGIGPGLSGHMLLDELALYLIVTYCVLAHFKKEFRVIRFDALTKQDWLFILLMIYLLFKSIEGAMIDPRVFRFALLFLSILILHILSAKASPNKTNSTSAIIISGVGIYLLAYLAQGYHHKLIVPYLGQFSSQGDFWSGSAYAVFPIILGMAIALKTLNQTKNILKKLSCWALISLCFSTSIFFDSRLGLITCIGFSLPLLLKTIQSKHLKVASIGIASVIIIATLTTDIITQIKFIDYALKLASALDDTIFFWLNPRESDYDRQAIALAGLITAKQSIFQFLFGSGIYTHKTELLFGLKALSLPLPTSGIVRPTGLPALLVDAGLIGVLLLYTSIYFAFLKVYQSITSNHFEKLICIMLVACIGIWPLITNVFDMTIYFLLIMPGGLLEILFANKDKLKSEKF